MTGWVDISNTAIDQDSAITVGLVTALRDNPRAITEGASGAPKMQTAALNDGCVTNAKLGADCVTNAKIADGAVGIENMLNPSASDAWPLVKIYQEDSATIKRYIVTKSGSYRVKTIGNSSVTVTVRINGSIVATQSAFTDSTAQDFDITVTAGDEITITPSGLSAGSSFTTKICCNHPFSFYFLET